MTIREAIETTDKLKPNQYTEAEKIMWLSTLDGIVHREVFLTHEGKKPHFHGYTEEKDYDTALLIPYPYDEVYRWYLEMKIDEANNETIKANISASKYNALYTAFMNYWNKTHMPRSTFNRFFF